MESVVDLIALDRGVYQDRKIHEHNADDLDGVLRAESIVYEDELIYESKDEQGEVCWDRLDIGTALRACCWYQSALEFGEDISWILLAGLFVTSQTIMLTLRVSMPVQPGQAPLRKTPTSTVYWAHIANSSSAPPTPYSSPSPVYRGTRQQAQLTPAYSMYSVDPVKARVKAAAKAPDIGCGSTAVTTKVLRNLRRTVCMMNRMRARWDRPAESRGSREISL